MPGLHFMPIIAKLDLNIGGCIMKIIDELQ